MFFYLNSLIIELELHFISTKNSKQNSVTHALYNFIYYRRGGKIVKIEHISLWTNQLEKLKDFYCTYFHAQANNKYINHSKGFESYFLSFDDGCRLEIMQMPSIPNNLNNTYDQYIGLIHFAISVGNQSTVVSLTERLKAEGYEVISNPRTTGDGYFESVILDPDGNRIEITI